MRQQREDTRSFLAISLLALLALVAILLIVGAAANWFTVNDAKDLALAILGPLTVLTGTVFGFYYGGDKNGKT